MRPLLRSPAASPASHRANELRQTLAGGHLPALDGLRAVSVVVVIAYHFGFPAPAGIGVAGFFVLSGFLITWLLRKELLETGMVSVRRFYVRRVLRIFPAYYVYVAISLVALLALGKSWPPALVDSTLVYAVNYYNAFHGHPPGSFSHLWSLAIEEQFYLLWPVLFVFFARRGSRALVSGLVSAIVLVLIWRTAVYLHTGNAAYVYNAFDTRFDSLAVGCLLAVCVEEGRFRSFVGTLTRSTWFPAVVLTLLMASQWAPMGYRRTLGFSVDSLLLALFIVQMLTLYRTPMWRWLQHATVRYIGLISYPMYLYHQWGIGVGYKATFLPSIGRFVLAGIVTIAAAAVSHHVVERPFLRVKKRFEAASQRPVLARQPEVARPVREEHAMGIHTIAAAPASDGTPSSERPETARFAFGKNWSAFLPAIDDQRITAAERSLCSMLGTGDLHGRSFLDVGSGSGLFSLAARRLGARVRSFDYDLTSVRCTAELKRRFHESDPDWTVEQGSVLDRRYLQSLGTYDIVYAWGVLHHTGSMWRALENVLGVVAPAGKLFLAIYNDQGNWSARWRRVKRLYCSSRFGRSVVCATFIPAFALRGLAADLVWMRNPWRRYAEYKRTRGMSVVRDWIDWLGGYPFEVAKPEQVFQFFRDRGLQLHDFATCGGSVGCNEFVFSRPSAVELHAPPSTAVASAPV